MPAFSMPPDFSVYEMRPKSHHYVKSLRTYRKCILDIKYMFQLFPRTFKCNTFCFGKYLATSLRYWEKIIWVNNVQYLLTVV